jgi:hypothetical protein
MDTRPLLSRDEAAGLVLAVAAHAGLVTWLALNPLAPKPLPLPERMTVTISDEVTDKSTAPDPSAQAAPAIAPVIAENPVPEPAPVAQPLPQPLPRPMAQPPRPVAQQPRPAPAKSTPAKPAGGGGSRFGDAFKAGIPGGQTPGARATTPPAQAIGPAVKSALSGAITRQLRPRWSAPQGADADLLITVLSWDMNPDGSLAGSPRVVSQSGITEANRAQAQRHAEQAIRAVRLAAPFELPSDLYAAWKHVAQFRFDRKLSQ